MRKMPKKLLTVFTAAALTVGALALPACSEFVPLDGDYASGAVASNGGFVVEKGNYYYFINGVETYTSDNTYGTPVKGALMRISKTDLKAKNNTAETVVPSLMVAADYTSGIYVYGDRVYYATPNNVKNTSGEIENNYLDFKSAKLDGSDIQSYFNVSDNSTVYRFVEVDNTVYVLYVSGQDLHSYNTVSKTDTVLAANTGAYVLNETDKTDATVYYTMSVTADIDSADGATARDYNQVYRVRADATEAPYEYKYDEQYLEDNDGKEPYTNLGTIVLDGIGSNFTVTGSDPTQFTHDLKDGVVPISPAGYTYTLLSYTNEGLYFTRNDLVSTGSVGETGWLYYLAESKLTASGWNSVSGNAIENFDAIAQNTDHANSSAIFYLDDNGHHYLYIDGSNMFRADVGTSEKGVAETTLVARDVSGATLISIDNASDETYDYVYYTKSGTTGNTVERAVYNGTEENYKILNYEENKPYQPVKVLGAEHASSWYQYEMIDGILFYADTKSFGSASYNYISCVDLNNANGKLKNNVEITEFNALYEKIVGGDNDDGYLTKLDEKDSVNLSNAIEYYFYMGQDKLFNRENDDYELTEDGYVTYESTLFHKNIQSAIDKGKKTTYLYSEEEQNEFRAYVEGKSDDSKTFVDDNGVSYRTMSYFVTRIGVMSDDDKESYENYWTSFLQSYTPAETETATIPAWGWALIGVGIGVVVVAAGLAVFFVLRARKRNDQQADEADEPMFVDTTDDKDVDVYAEAGQPSAADEQEEIADGSEQPADETEAADEIAENVEAPAESEDGADKTEE